MKQLTPTSIVAPGFFGLNTQESSVTLSPNYALTADNCIIDQYGRMGARKGWTMQTVDGADELSGQVVEGIFEHVNADNTVDILVSGNNKVLLQEDDFTLTDITPSLYTISNNNWKASNLNDHSLLVQQDQEPLIFTRESGSPVLHPESSHTAHGGPYTPSFGTSYPRDGIAAYGRFWVHDGETIYWSTDIADSAFPAFSGGTSGTLNIASVLPKNVDTIVALTAHNDFLIIFCERNIVIYSGANNPLGDFQLHDIIDGVGCIARDSVQGTGNDLIFLSDTGIRSLGRLIQEKSLPMRDLTKNVRDDLLKDITQERSNSGGLSKVRAVYSEINAFYLLSFPSTETIYCLDMRQAMEDGSSRVTVWFSYKATALLRRRDREVMIGKVNGIGRYFGYNDDGSAYRLRYFSHYLDMGAPTTNKILKQISATVIGGSNQSFTIKTNFDYKEAPRSYPYTIVTGDVSEYGVDKYVEYVEFKGTVPNYAGLPVSPTLDDAYMVNNSPIVYDGSGNNISDDVDEGKVFQWNGSAWIDVTSTWQNTFTVNIFSEYSIGIVLDSIKASVGGSGNTIQIGFEADVNGSELSVQKIDMFVKTGRTS